MCKKLRSEGATRRIRSFWSINRGQADNLDLIRSPNYTAWSRISAGREAAGGSAALCPYPRGGPGTRGAGDGTRTRRAPPSCLPRILASCPATPWWSQDAVEGQKPLRAPAREPCTAPEHPTRARPQPKIISAPAAAGSSVTSQALKCSRSEEFGIRRTGGGRGPGPPFPGDPLSPTEKFNPC